MRSGQFGSSEIVNPAKLTPARRDSVCAQCHLAGEVRVSRAGRDPRSFRPGELLSDYQIAFVRRDAPPGIKVNSHVEKLAQSACRRASGDRLWCGSCHDPHSVPDASHRVAWFRDKCLACHPSGQCSESSAARMNRGDDCAACHMPRSGVTDVEHAVYTDHSIPRHPRRAAVVAAARAADLVPFGGGAVSTRDLALAFALLPLKDAHDQARATELLRKAQAEAPDDPQILLHLADSYNRASDQAHAAPLYEQVLHADPAQVAAEVNVANALANRGEIREAMRLWKEALSRSPGLEVVRMNLALAQVRAGDLAGAQSTLTKALELNPGLATARVLLDEVRGRSR